MDKIYKISPNYSKKLRKKREIEFVIFHYTGMQSEIASIKRLTDPRSKVSCHYLIGRTGKVVQIVSDLYTSWHAGKSKWKNFKNLNEKSIGIELVNRGHGLGYQNFTKRQIRSLILLSRKLKKKYKIKCINFLGHSDIAPLRKIDPGEKFPWKELSRFNLGRWYRDDKKELKFDQKIMNKLFFKNLRKIGYRYFNINRSNRSDIKIIKSFQRHYLPKNVTGKIDQKTYRISHYLTL